MGLGLVVLQFAGTVGEEVTRGVETEAIHTAGEPLSGDALHLPAHGGLLVVEIRHAAPEDAVVILAVLVVAVPDGTVAPGLGPAGIVGAPDVPVAVDRIRRGGRVLEPGVLVAGVIDDEVEDDLDPPLVGRGQEAVEVLVGAVVGLDLLVIDRVVAVIARGGEDGHQPESVHSEIGVGLGIAVVEVVQLGRQSLEIADAIGVGIREAADEDLVEDGSPRPFVIPLSWRNWRRRRHCGRNRVRRWRRAGVAGEHEGNEREKEQEARGAAVG